MFPISRLCRPAAASLALVLSACSVSSASHTPTVTPVPSSTPTPTPGVTFVVAVTAVATPRPTWTVPPRPRPPTATPVSAFLALQPTSGPPEARTIHVSGANLPASETVQLVWSPEGRFSPVETTAYTGSHGRLNAQFHVPGSPPGRYSVMVQLNGVTEASASYRVTSYANMTVAIVGSSQGESIQIQGRRFLGNLHVILIAYPLSTHARTVILGSVTTNGRGSFRLQRVTRKLVPGQYVVRAFSTDAVSAQMAEQFLEVVS